MTKMKVVLLATLLVSALVVSPARADKPDWMGIWDWGTSLDRNDVPPLKGKLVFAFWKDIEPEPGVFDFTSLDNKITIAAGRDLYVIFKVYVGHNSPTWVYQNGVPEVVADARSYPYYLDEDFKRFFKRLITRVAEHIDTYEPEVRRKIVGVQGPMGKSGDEMPWSYQAVQVGEPYYIDPQGTEWRDYNREMAKHYYDSYKNKDPALVLFLNLRENNEAWAINAIPGVGRKATKVCQAHLFNNEMDWSWRVETLRQFHGNYAVRARGEFTHPVRRAAEGQWFFDAPIWNMYWQILWDLTYGVDVLNAVYAQAAFIQDQDWADHEPAWHFFNKYAGFKDPRDSTGAWIALRDSLDVEDTARFPEGVFGPVERGANGARYDSIAASQSAYGATQGDITHQTGMNASYYNEVDLLNDVNYRVWPGNYGMFLSQLHPLETSQGYWRVGSKDEPYGRFARGFDHATGKDAMYFDIADGFFFDQPLDGAYPITVRVVYFDDGSGTWQLRYDAVGNGEKVALEVTKANTGTWDERVVVLDDGYFGNRGPQNADLVLFNDDAEDDLFHMIEVSRETGDRKCFWGYGVYPDPNCDLGDASIPDASVGDGGDGGHGGDERDAGADVGSDPESGVGVGTAGPEPGGGCSCGQVLGGIGVPAFKGWTVVR